MNNVIEIENYQGWLVLSPKCLDCKYKWVAVAPKDVDVTKLQCPKCNNQKTMILL